MSFETLTLLSLNLIFRSELPTTIDRLEAMNSTETKLDPVLYEEVLRSALVKQFPSESLQNTRIQDRETIISAIVRASTSQQPVAHTNSKSQPMVSKNEAFKTERPITQVKAKSEDCQNLHVQKEPKEGIFQLYQEAMLELQKSMVPPVSVETTSLMSFQDNLTRVNAIAQAHQRHCVSDPPGQVATLPLPFFVQTEVKAAQQPGKLNPKLNQLKLESSEHLKRQVQEKLEILESLRKKHNLEREIIINLNKTRNPEEQTDAEQAKADALKSESVEIANEKTTIGKRRSYTFRSDEEKRNDVYKKIRESNYKSVIASREKSKKELDQTLQRAYYLEKVIELLKVDLPLPQEIGLPESFGDRVYYPPEKVLREWGLRK